VLVIKLRDRNNIKVYNTTASRVCVRAATREYEFEGAVDGVYPMHPMSFADIEYVNSRNPDVFPTGLLTFEESERDEIYQALNHSDWEDRIWDDDMIKDALLRPTKVKMERILAVRDILTIERIRGVMTNIINTSIQKPIDRVIDAVNSRMQEILRGIKRSRLLVVLPEDIAKDDVEKSALKKKNDELENQLRAMQEQINALMEMKKEEKPSPVAKKTTRKKTE
jgi:hypothetical protein